MAIAWMYHRKNCNTCKKATAYLEKKKQTVTEVVDCKKNPHAADEALELAKTVTEIQSMKGKKLVVLKMKDGPSDEQILELMLGPTGGLRAPTIRQGKKLLVGFSEEAYDGMMK